MVFRLGQLTDPVGEIERLAESAEFERALELGDAVDLDDLPVGNLGVQRGNFVSRRGLRWLVARFALLGGESSGHGTPPSYEMNGPARRWYGDCTVLRKRTCGDVPLTFDGAATTLRRADDRRDFRADGVTRR